VWPFKKRRRSPVEGGRAQEGPTDAVDAFWSWWQGARDRVARAIESQEAIELADDISSHVKAMDGGLAWELGPGRTSRHHLCVTGEGDMRLRVLAERWLARAPDPDETWEYYPARQPDPKCARQTLRLDGVPVHFDAFRVGTQVNDAHKRINVEMFHPAFGALKEEQRATAAFLFLDQLLGEDDVERWIGCVDFSDEPSPDSVSADELRSKVHALAGSHEEEHYTLIQGQTDGGSPVLVLARLGLKRVDHLLLDTHFEVRIRVDDVSENGLPTSSEADSLNDMEDALINLLGPDAVYVARETFDRQRIIHLHAASDGPVPSKLERWERVQPMRQIDTSARLDPAWEVLDRW
jgi:hypothetical protein